MRERKIYTWLDIERIRFKNSQRVTVSTGVSFKGGAVSIGWGVAYVTEFNSIVGFANPKGFGNVPIPLAPGDAYKIALRIDFLPEK